MEFTMDDIWNLEEMTKRSRILYDKMEERRFLSRLPQHHFDYVKRCGDLYYEFNELLNKITDIEHDLEYGLPKYYILL